MKKYDYIITSEMFNTFFYYDGFSYNWELWTNDVSFAILFPNKRSAKKQLKLMRKEGYCVFKGIVIKKFIGVNKW